VNADAEDLGKVLMEIHLLATVSGNDRIHWFHTTMFHGKRAVEDLDYFTMSVEEKKQVSGPLKLVRNGWRIPDFCMPSGLLMVSSRVKEALAGIGTIAFRPVEFVKLIEYPYQAGDFSYPKTHNRVFDPATLFDQLPDVPRLHKTIGAYFELIHPSIYQVGAQANTDPPTSTLRVPWISYSDSRHQVSQALVNTYPILRAGYLILNEPAFAALSPFIDWDYFERIETEI
jgi:hypothetical protein